MKTRAYTVFDSAAGAYLEPFFALNDATACRSFQRAAQDPQHGFYSHAEDYTLFFCGEFDDTTGTFVASAPVSLGNALQYKAGVK